MLKRLIMFAALTLSLSATCAFADDFPDEIFDKIASMKASSEAKIDMPASLPGMSVISPADAYKMFQTKKAVFLDNRIKSNFDAEKIKGAEWFFADDLMKNPDFAKKLDKEKDYIFYCNGTYCYRSPAVGLMLAHLGFKKLHWLRDGFPGWKKAGYPVE